MRRGSPDLPAGPRVIPEDLVCAPHAADERVRTVEVHRERVVLRRALRGIKMAVNLPVALYRGVSIRVQETATDASRTITLVLEHPDPDLSVTLCRAPDASEIIAEWQS